ncbi:MAG: hypothetical protein AAGI15_02050 [Pseudomonadota bacterium]
MVLAAALLGSAWLLLTLGWQTLLKALLAGALALLLLRWLVNTVREYRLLRRREALLERYGDEQVVDDLLEQVLWEGETAAQVRDSLGEPQAVDVLPRQTKKKELWKYGHEGGNRYRLRVTLDDDLVVSWVLRD